MNSHHINDQVPSKLVEDAKAKGIVVMVGAGVSVIAPSSLPGWYRLNSLIVESLSGRIDHYLKRPGYTSQIVNELDRQREKNLFPPDYQAQILHEISGDRYFKAVQALDIRNYNQIHRNIAWLAKKGFISAIVTTNFDRLTEYALDDNDVPYDVAYEVQSYGKCLNVLQDSNSTRLQILKVHGCVQDHTSMIDTLKQRLQGRNDNLNRCLQFLLERFHWLFAGFSAADLESDKNYLQLIPCAPKSPGITYIQWPGAPNLSKGANLLLESYATKGEKITADLDLFFSAFINKLGLTPPPNPVIEHPPQDSMTQVKNSLSNWAQALHPAAAINCYAGIMEANGKTELAFQLLNKFWKEVFSRDRTGEDFEQYRMFHGRLGMGIGLFSYVEDMNTTAGEESFQNLLRVGQASKGLSLAWAGLTLMWAGQNQKAFPMFSQAISLVQSSESTDEEKIDTLLANGEFLYILGEPETFYKQWQTLAGVARKIGDLPRLGKVLGLTALYYADFISKEFEWFMEKIVSQYMEQITRLHDPTIQAFIALARGRYYIKTHQGESARTYLSAANSWFKVAGRYPWQHFAYIEYSKALVDLGQIDQAADILNKVNKSVDRYQILLVWLYEATGQLNMAISNSEKAREDFSQAIDFAKQCYMKSRASILTGYLNR